MASYSASACWLSHMKQQTIEPVATVATGEPSPSKLNYEIL